MGATQRPTSPVLREVDCVYAQPTSRGGNETLIELPWDNPAEVILQPKPIIHPLEAVRRLITIGQAFKMVKLICQACALRTINAGKTSCVCVTVILVRSVHATLYCCFSSA
jgi:hypothetical protein